MSVTILLPTTDETIVLIQTVEILYNTLGGEILEILLITSPRLTTPGARETIALIKKTYGKQIIDFDQTLPGLGGAYRDGFKAARGDYVILMASDFETDPNSAVLLLKTIKEQNADVVACSRWLTKAGFSGYNFIKFICNFLFQKIFQLLYHTTLTDLTFGYRIYKNSIVKNITWEEEGFSFLFESLIKPLKYKKIVKEIPSCWVPRKEGSSHILLSSYYHYFKIGIKTLFLKGKDIHDTQDRQI